MTPRETHKRIRAYARASKREAETWCNAQAMCRLPLGVAAGYSAYQYASDFRRAYTATARERTAHAWSRLPVAARAAIRDPRED